MTVESLENINDAELLERVKSGINLNGNDYQNESLSVWIEDVKQDLIYAGVSADVANSTLAVGCITRGVDDRWLSHLPDYSDFFNKGVERLRNIKVKEA